MAEVTGAPPPALAVKPEVLPGFGSYLEAFEVLCGSRGVGFGGPLPIPLSEIESYCRLTAWRDPDAVAELVAIVGALDAVYLDAMARRSGGEEIYSRPEEKADRRAGIDRGTRLNALWPGRWRQKSQK